MGKLSTDAGPSLPSGPLPPYLLLLRFNELKVKTERAKRGLFANGVKIFNTLTMRLKKEKVYLPFKQGHEEMLMG